MRGSRSSAHSLMLGPPQLLCKGCAEWISSTHWACMELLRDYLILLRCNQHYTWIKSNSPLFSPAGRLNRCGRTEAWKVCPWEKSINYLETWDANSYEPHSSSDTCLGKSTWKQIEVVKVSVWSAKVESRQLFSKWNMVKMGTSKRWHGKLHSSASCGLPWYGSVQPFSRSKHPPSPSKKP